jgi:hypothetical protein
MGWATFWAIFSTSSSGHPDVSNIMQNASVDSDDMRKSILSPSWLLGRELPGFKNPTMKLELSF